MKNFNYRDVFINNDTGEVLFSYYKSEETLYGINFEMDYEKSTQKETDYYHFLHGANIDFKARNDSAGLHDCEGKEIYEGDIIEVYPNHCPVYYEVFFDKEDPSFCLKGINTEAIYYFREVTASKKVIGNIYQDSHLLEEPTQ